MKKKGSVNERRGQNVEPEFDRLALPLNEQYFFQKQSSRGQEACPARSVPH